MNPRHLVGVLTLYVISAASLYTDVHKGSGPPRTSVYSERDRNLHYSSAAFGYQSQIMVAIPIGPIWLKTNWVLDLSSGVARCVRRSEGLTWTSGDRFRTYASTIIRLQQFRVVQHVYGTSLEVPDVMSLYG